MLLLLISKDVIRGHVVVHGAVIMGWRRWWPVVDLRLGIRVRRVSKAWTWG